MPILRVSSDLLVEPPDELLREGAEVEIKDHERDGRLERSRVVTVPAKVSQK